jgi:hypothetical protein
MRVGIKTSVVFALITYGVVWSTALTHARAVAAKEKAGPGRPWMGEFVGLGWRQAATPRGRKFAGIATTLLWVGPPLFLVLFLILSTL